LSLRAVLSLKRRPVSSLKKPVTHCSVFKTFRPTPALAKRQSLPLPRLTSISARLLTETQTLKRKKKQLLELV
jgi:hypothetical protein